LSPSFPAALERERALHQREKEEKTATITSMKEELTKLKNLVATRRKTAGREAAAGTAGKLRAYAHDEATLRRQLAELQKRKELEDAVHAQTVSFLKKQQEVRAATS
jgi:hypothetical protein